MFASVPWCVHIPYLLSRVPAPYAAATPLSQPRAPTRPRDPLPCCSAYFLWAFFGLFGAHRFYVGRYESGLVYMFTLGGFFVGWAYDFFILPQLVEEVRAYTAPPPLFSRWPPPPRLFALLTLLLWRAPAEK